MTNQFANFDNRPDAWIKERTLGGRSKAFCWKFDHASNLCIDRLFEAGGGYIKFTAAQVDQIADYVA